MKTGPKPRPAPERFWSKVNVGLCWEWTGTLQSQGYGNFKVGDRTWALAHRYAWEMLVGPIPQGMWLDHLCRNHQCVNPDHLEPVTPRENARRGIGHGRETHCPQGHPYSGSNVRFRARGSGRDCRACDRERARIRRETR